MSLRKSPAKRRSVVEDEDPIDVEAPTTQPQTSKFLKREGHGTWHKPCATSAGVASCFKLRIHACISQKDTEEFKHGEETGNYMIAVTTPKGPPGKMSLYMDQIKLEADTVRLRADFRFHCKQAFTQNKTA